jgi:hypothetical protein
MFLNDYTYALSPTPDMIIRSDGAHIPIDDANRDYVDYLAWVAAGNTATPVPTPDLASTIKSYSDLLDSNIAAIYSTWMRFDQEYLQREAAAQAFTAANYQGDPGVWVTAFSTAAGISTTQASALILQQAAALNGALSALGAQRMRKYEIASQTSVADVEAKFNEIMTQVQAITAAIK